jgi:hypothetical protein
MCEEGLAQLLSAPRPDAPAGYVEIIKVEAAPKAYKPKAQPTSRPAPAVRKGKKGERE